MQHRDHPRLRGEQGTRYTDIVLNVGSPPLARGTDRRAIDSNSYGGITPACAGNRIHVTVPLSASADHPRLRGEQLFRSVVDEITLGSPPLARGTVIAQPQ